MNYAELIAKLSGDDAKQLLMHLADDHEDIAELVTSEGLAYVREDSPDWEDVAGDVQMDLEGIDVQDLWDRSGATARGYRDLCEVAYEMLEDELTPYWEQMDKYATLGLAEELLACCQGILAGLYAFDHESTTEFKDHVPDEVSEIAGETLERWLKLKPGTPARQTLRQFLEQQCPNYVRILDNVDRRQEKRATA